MKKRAIYFSIVSLSAVLVAAGCGGGGGVQLHTPPVGNVNFSSGAAIPDTVTADAVMPATGGVIVHTADNGDVLIPSVAVPAGTVIHAGDPLTVIPAGTGFVGSFAPGTQVEVNGESNSGAMLGSDGLLDQKIGFPSTDAGMQESMSFPGGDLTTRSLTVQRFEFAGRFYVQRSPFRIVSPVPIALVGALPNNGENAAGSTVTAAFGPGNNGRTATLFIDYGTGFTLQKTVTIENNRCVFANIQTDQQNVPPTGVQLVRLSIGDL